MRSYAVAAVALCASTFVAAAPPFPGGVVFPLKNGFPNPSPAELKAIEQEAFGTEPNGPPPPSVSADGIVNLQLIALNEIFEVAFFTELLYNITHSVPGYEFPSANERTFALETISAIKAQEELHALNANGALAHFNAEPIEPCDYSFPVSTFDEAIGLAATFTSVVLGTLQDVSGIFAVNGDSGLVPFVASVIGQEGEQQGWFRVEQGKRPSELPFLTASARDFAFTAIQSFTLPGSCKNIHTIPLTTFLPLNLLTPASAKSTSLQFEYTLPASADPNIPYYVVYINQQNVPVVEETTVLKKSGSTYTVEAPFPYVELEMNGLTIAAVTKAMGPFSSAAEVANTTMFGPAIIIIN